MSANALKLSDHARPCRVSGRCEEGCQNDSSSRCKGISDISNKCEWSQIHSRRLTNRIVILGSIILGRKIRRQTGDTSDGVSCTKEIPRPERSHMGKLLCPFDSFITNLLQNW